MDTGNAENSGERKKTALQHVSGLPREQQIEMIEGAMELTTGRVQRRLGEMLTADEVDELDALNEDEKTDPDSAIAALRRILKEGHGVELDDLIQNAAAETDEGLTRDVEQSPMDHYPTPPTPGDE